MLEVVLYLDFLDLLIYVQTLGCFSSEPIEKTEHFFNQGVIPFGFNYPLMGGYMKRFSEHEIQFFKRLKKNCQGIDSEAIKYFTLIILISATLFLIPLVSFIN
jgi:hypothetical protein